MTDLNKKLLTIRMERLLKEDKHDSILYKDGVMDMYNQALRVINYEGAEECPQSSKT